MSEITCVRRCAPRRGLWNTSGMRWEIVALHSWPWAQNINFSQRDQLRPTRRPSQQHYLGLARELPSEGGQTFSRARPAMPLMHGGLTRWAYVQLQPVSTCWPTSQRVIRPGQTDWTPPRASPLLGPRAACLAPSFRSALIFRYCALCMLPVSSCPFLDRRGMPAQAASWGRPRRSWCLSADSSSAAKMNMEIRYRFVTRPCWLSLAVPDKDARGTA
jgi:hypothetical protein